MQLHVHWEATQTLLDVQHRVKTDFCTYFYQAKAE